ncbi:MAG: ankyrin repeat domain-containing protein [Bacteroidota bacterium]
MKNIWIVLLILCSSSYLAGQNIHRTACNGNLARLDSMLATTKIEVKDEQGRSLLHWAVACKQKAVFDFLIGKGIKIDQTDRQGKTPLHIAVQFNNIEYVDYLIEIQIDHSWKKAYGASLLCLSVLNKNKVLTEKLISEGVDINGKNSRGSTALEIAKRIGAKDLEEYLLTHGANEKLVRKFNLEGKYMGQNPPKASGEMFLPHFISTEEEEFGSVFNKSGTEFYYGVHLGRRNEIRYSKLAGGKWTQPIAILSHERFSYNDPFLSNDENRLYFISQMALDGQGAVKDIDIWYVEKKGDGWSEPINAGPNINTAGEEYYISFTQEGTMYFSSDGHKRADTSRKDHDIYYAKFVDNEFQAAVLLDSAVNTPEYEADVFVAPDESYLIFCSTRKGGFGGGDLYISFKNEEGNWTQAVNMGKEVNTPNYEYCPFVSKDGKSLFYTSNQDIYWLSTDIIEELRQKSR